MSTQEAIYIPENYNYSYIACTKIQYQYTTQHKVLRHFNTEEKKAEIIPLPGPSPNPNHSCKHQALIIWLQVTADDCGALHRL